MPISQASGRPRPTVRAFTLMETVVALAISTVLLLSLGSTVLLASRSIPTGREPFIREGQVQRSLALMVSDIEVANAVSIGTNEFVLTVADRDGDGAQETVTYSWKAGDRMVLRTRSGASAETLFGPVTAGMIVPMKDGDVQTGLYVIFVIPGVSPSDRAVGARMLNLPEG